MLAKTKDNWAESIALRREVQSKLNMVHDSLKMIENIIIQRSEDNNEKIAVLQSLLEDPFCRQDIEELLASYSKCEADHMDSKQELALANFTGNSLSEIEDFVCCLSLKNNSTGTSFNIKALENMTLAYSNKSPHGPHMGSYKSILSFILFKMREENQWKAADGTEDDTDQAQACLPNGKKSFDLKEKKRLSVGHERLQMSSDECSTTDSESSSGEEFRMCYMEFQINNVVQPKVIFRLNFNEAPMMSSRFMDYCTGSSGLSYKNCTIFMVKLLNTLLLFLSFLSPFFFFLFFF